MKKEKKENIIRCILDNFDLEKIDFFDNFNNSFILLKGKRLNEEDNEKMINTINIFNKNNENMNFFKKRKNINYKNELLLIRDIFYPNLC